MAHTLSDADIYTVLRTLKHPDNQERDLVALGMIPEINVGENQVDITLALPFPHVSIKGQLIAQIHDAVRELDNDIRIQVRAAQMTPEQRADFMVAMRGEDPDDSRQLVRQVIAVMSGKGGVGKSSITGLLACALRRDGYKVGVLDADITGPSMPKLFGAHRLPPGTEGGMRPVETRTGIKLMSINLLLADDGQPVIWRGPLIGRAIEQFWRDSVWGELDYLIVDLPPGTSDAALTVAQMLPLKGFVLVTSPQDLAGMVVRKAANMAKQLGIPLVGLVENMSYAVCPSCGAVVEVFGPSRADEVARQIGTDLLTHIPLDPKLATLCDNGQVEDYRCSSLDAVVTRLLEVVPPTGTVPEESALAGETRQG